MTARQCLHADPSFMDGTLYVIARITEAQPGYSIAYRVKSLALARRFAEASNEAAGLTADDVWTIRLSSMMGPVRFDANTARRADHTPAFAREH